METPMVNHKSPRRRRRGTRLPGIIIIILHRRTKIVTKVNTRLRRITRRRKTRFASTRGLDSEHILSQQTMRIFIVVPKKLRRAVSVRCRAGRRVPEPLRVSESTGLVSSRLVSPCLVLLCFGISFLTSLAMVIAGQAPIFVVAPLVVKRQRPPPIVVQTQDRQT